MVLVSNWVGVRFIGHIILYNIWYRSDDEYEKQIRPAIYLPKTIIRHQR